MTGSVTWGALHLFGVIDTLLDVPTIIAGHGYDTGALPRGEPSGDNEESGGIGTTTILVVALLAVGTVAVLLWLSPSRAKVLGHLRPSHVKPRLRAAAPLALAAVFIAAPLIAWAASSDEDEPPELIVERARAQDGSPEILVALDDDELNSLKTTNGKRAVRVECRGRDGRVIVDGRHRWPFVGEVGYDAPHAHQKVSREQLQRAARCRLRGTRVRLEADVEGPLTG
jgi:hypothetical protein